MTAQDRGDTPTDIAQVCGAFTEVLVVDGRELVSLAVRRLKDRDIRRLPGLDEGDSRLHDPRVAGEQRLSLEDRPDVLACSRTHL